MTNICQRCQELVEEDDLGDNLTLMHREAATDETRSNGSRESLVVCWECAWELFETGEWQADNNEFNTEPSVTADGITYHMEPFPEIHFVASAGDHVAIGRSEHQAVLTCRAYMFGYSRYDYIEDGYPEDRR